MTGAPGRHLFTNLVLGKYDAKYILDESIDYIWVENPTWLDEAYSNPMAISDTGIMKRNLRNVSFVANLMRRNGLANARGIDLGAGYGIFVRGIRDIGINFNWSDNYASNLLARGFEVDDAPYEVAVAFEVLEHLQNPLEFLLASKSKHGWSTLIFTATCFNPKDLPKLDWWYWAFESGQHIAFFSISSLEYIASKLGMRLLHFNSDLFAFTERHKLIWPTKFSRWLINRKYKCSSLTYVDYIEMKRISSK